MKLKVTVLLGLSMLVFSGCGGPYLHTGLSADKAKQYPLLMIANNDVVCGDHIFKKGAKFSVSDASYGKYISQLYSEKQTFPEKTLFVSTQEGSGVGIVVYPNGKFVYEDGGLVMIRAFNASDGANTTDKVLLWSIDSEVKCKFKGDVPFFSKKF